MVLVRPRAARALLFDGLPAVAVGVVAGVVSPLAARGMGEGRSLGPPAFALIGLAAVALLGRRRWPAAVLAVTIAASTAYLAVGYPPGPVFLLPALAMYSLAVRAPVRPSLGACVAAMLVVIAGHLYGLRGTAAAELLAEAPSMLGWAAGWMILPWAVGTVVRLGREEAVRTREEEARRRAYEERLRMAREIHDVVGHGLAVINMQAGVALHVLGKRRDGDRHPDQVETALEAIKGASKSALDELRGTLAVFRRPDDAGAPRRPAPGLGQLETLVAEMAESGLPVDLTVSGERPSVTGGVDLAAYRIVQESLTNVLRHAGPASATVRVSYGRDEVALEILDDGAGPKPGAQGGHGITGMRERATAVGGTLQAGPRSGGGFRVHARLPIEGAGA